MPRTIILDFETYFDSDYSLRKLSVPEYIHDRRFKVHGLAVDDGKSQVFLTPDEIEAFLKTVQNDIIICHHAFFDAAILRWHYDFQPAYILDTLLMANHVLGSARDTGQRNDLATLANRLGIEAKGKELDSVKGVRNLDETQFTILAEYAKRDARITRKVYNHLFAQMTNVEFELWLMDHTLRIYTDKLLAVDLDKIKATIQLVQKRRVEVVKASGVTPEVLASNKQFAAELTARLKTAGIPMPMKTPPKPRKDGVKSIPALAKLDAGFIALSDSPADAVRNLVRGRLVERSASTAIARLTKMKMFHGIGGIPVHLVYYGAHTGRFSGGGGFNFQNLTSPARATDSVDREIASSIREAFSPGEGNVFVACDAAQIEARVLAWLAGEDQITEAFRRGADIYSEFISGVLEEEVRKPKDTDTPEHAAHLKLMRQIGKEAVLGLGYSMGVDKFMVRLRQDRGVAKMMDAGKITPELCANVVRTYRDTYTRIPEFWTKLNRAFLASMTGARRTVGKLVFQKAGPRAVSITLPSGRKLYYRDIRSEKYDGVKRFTNLKGEKTEAEEHKKEWKHGAGQRIYGGLLAENVTQAIARDILAESIHDAEEGGYPVVLHVHDEIVCRVPEVQGPAALQFLTESLSTPPSWGAGMVLGAEGHVAKNLSK